MIHQKQIEKFKQLPNREKVGFNLKTKSWYEDDFQKSANEYYGRGKCYFINCGNKYVGKHVQQLIFKLKSNSDYIHNKSFKKAVDDLIYTDLLTDVSNPINSGNYLHRNDWFFVDENNLVQNINILKYINVRHYENIYLRDTNYFKQMFPQYVSIANDLWSLNLIKDHNEIFEFYHSTFKYVVRVNGLHYYITNEELSYVDIVHKYIPRLKATHQVVINNSLIALQLLKLSVNDLKYHGLIDIKENVKNLINFKD